MSIKFISLDTQTPAVSLQQLSILQADCFNHPWSDSQIERQLKDLKGLNFACLYGQQLLGFLFYQLLFECAEILQIGISSRHRNQGLAEQLITHSLFFLQQREIEKVLLEVNVENIQALNLYKKMHFTTDGLRKNYYPSAQQGGRPIDARLLSLALISDDQR